MARHALEHGASELAVASVEEGIVLRKAGITAPILVLGFTSLSCVKKSAAWNITLSAFQVDWMKEANEILKEASANRLAIHINVDTGMGRLGVRTKEELLEVVKALKASKFLRWTGIFTHFRQLMNRTQHSQSCSMKNSSVFSAFKNRGLSCPPCICATRLQLSHFRNLALI